MTRVNVTSSNVRFLSYDEANSELEVGFEAPETELCYVRVYRYFNLPKNTYDALISYPSTGEFLCKYIAYEYQYEYLGLEGELEK